MVSNFNKPTHGTKARPDILTRRGSGWMGLWVWIGRIGD